VEDLDIAFVDVVIAVEVDVFAEEEGDV